MASWLASEMVGPVVKSCVHAVCSPGESDGRRVMGTRTVAVDLSGGAELFQPASPVDVTVGGGTGKP